MDNKQIHEKLRPLEWLIGRWKSVEASVFYPTIKTMNLDEDMEFIPFADQPVLKHRVEAVNVATNEKMHAEVGFLKVDKESNKVALLMTHEIGCTEISEGTITEGKHELTLANISLETMSFFNLARTEAAKRIWKMDGDVLIGEIHMATKGHPLQKHVVAKYKRV